MWNIQEGDTNEVNLPQAEYTAFNDLESAVKVSYIVNIKIGFANNL